MPTADSQAATKAYVDAMVATAGVPEVPAVPAGQVWARELGQWVPITPQTGVFLPLSGGTMTGNIAMSGNTINGLASVPSLPNGAAPAQWVLNQIASVSLFQGQWDADTNVPDLTQLSVRVNGYTWIAVTTSVSGVVVGQAIPGLQGKTIFNGDTIYYSTVDGVFFAIHAGGLTLPEADARYVQLTGSQMSGALLLNANASQPLQAVTLQQLQSFVPPGAVTEAPNDGQLYGRNGLTASWAPVLPLAGGILTGSLTLSGNATANLNPVPLQQMTTAITAATAGYLPLAGGAMTGAMTLNANAAVGLNPVPLQQLTAMLASYAPLNNPTFTGTVTIPAGANIAGYLPTSGGTLTGSVTMTGTGFALAFGSAASPTAVIGTNGEAGFVSINVTSGMQVSANPAGSALAVLTGVAQFTGNAAGVAVDITGGTLMTSQNIRPASDNTVNVGFAGAAFNGVGAYAFNQQSDPRLKKDSATAPAGALEKVLAIPVINFRWNVEPETAPLHTGFDASQIQAQLPSGAPAVGIGTDPNQTLSLNTTELIAWLWQAVQELAQKANIT